MSNRPPIHYSRAKPNCHKCAGTGIIGPAPECHWLCRDCFRAQPSPERLVEKLEDASRTRDGSEELRFVYWSDIIAIVRKFLGGVRMEMATRTKDEASK